eukprot:4470549-Prymnesium_polylepis.1
MVRPDGAAFWRAAPSHKERAVERARARAGRAERSSKDGGAVARPARGAREEPLDRPSAVRFGRGGQTHAPRTREAGTVQ